MVVYKMKSDWITIDPEISSLVCLIAGCVCCISVIAARPLFSSPARHSDRNESALQFPETCTRSTRLLLSTIYIAYIYPKMIRSRVPSVFGSVARVAEARGGSICAREELVADP